MEILKEFPAYKLTKPMLLPVLSGFGQLAAHYTDGQVIALPYETRSQGTLYSFFTLGSVVGDALLNCECPEAALARARQFGHTLWWANQNGTVLTSHKRAQEFHPLHEWGDAIRFHGRTFTLEHDHNSNCKLVEVSDRAIIKDHPNDQ